MIELKPKITAAKIIITALILLLLFFYRVNVNLSPRSDMTIRLHEDQIDIQKLNNAIAEFIIEKGYGYPVEKIESTIKEVHTQLVTGDVDATLELWKKNNRVWHNRALKEGSIEDLGVIYGGEQQYWIIPAWYAEEKQIKTVFDMQKHWRDFADPEDPSKGLFFNCIFGWSCRDVNRIKLQAYGLDRYYNTVSPTSPDALKAIYKTARSRKVPVFGYYWEPNPIMTDEDWYILEEPPHSEELWTRITEASVNPELPPVDAACASKSSSVYKVAHMGLPKKAPDVFKMLKKMQIDTNLFNGILLRKNKKAPENKSFEALARFFLTHHPDQWHGWVTPKAQKKIEQALLACDNPDSRK